MKYTHTAIKCIEDESKALLELIPNIDDNFDKAVDIILQCKGKLIVTGVGKSGHIGAKIAATLSSTGTPSFFINPLDAFHGDLGVIQAEDVVLALSNSGQTDELLRFLPYLIEHKIPVIGMSGNPESLLAKYATAHLNSRVSREACPLGLAPTSSTTAAPRPGRRPGMCADGGTQLQGYRFRTVPSRRFARQTTAHQAKDVMRSDDLPVVDPQTKLGEAVIHVSNGRLGLCVPVVDGKVVGLVTDGDIRRAMESSQDRFFQLTVADIMTKTPKMVSPEMKITDIEQVLHQNKIHCVLVVDEEKHLLGVVDSFRTML